jgi:hypothetical protein
MKMRNLLFILPALLALAGFAPPVQAQAAGTETVTWIDSGCTTTVACTLQLSREALAPGVSTCDAAGSAKYSALNTAAIVPTVGQVNTAWVYQDTAIVQGITYCYVATVTATASGQVSAPSSPLLAAVPAAPAPPPPVGTAVYTPGV